MELHASHGLPDENEILNSFKHDDDSVSPGLNADSLSISSEPMEEAKEELDDIQDLEEDNFPETPLQNNNSDSDVEILSNSSSHDSISDESSSSSESDFDDEEPKNQASDHDLSLISSLENPPEVISKNSPDLADADLPISSEPTRDEDDKDTTSVSDEPARFDDVQDAALIANKPDELVVEDDPTLVEDNQSPFIPIPEQIQVPSTDEESSSDEESASSKDEDIFETDPPNFTEEEEDVGDQNIPAEDHEHNYEDYNNDLLPPIDNDIQVYDIDEIPSLANEAPIEQDESENSEDEGKEIDEDGRSNASEEIPALDEVPTFNFDNESHDEQNKFPQKVTEEDPKDAAPDIMPEESVQENADPTLLPNEQNQPNNDQPNIPESEAVIEEDGVVNPVDASNNLHGNVVSDSSSSSDNESSSLSDHEDTNFIDAPLEADPPASRSGNGELAESLKRALEERDKEQENNDPLKPNGYVDDYRFSADIDDASLRARTASDFKSEPLPPMLPPKMSVPPALPPKEKNKNKLSLKSKSGNRNRGRWSDDDDEFARPHAHQRKPLHPPPDRVIDFSHTPRQERKSRGSDDRSYRRQRDPSNRVIDISHRPTEDINDVFRRQAMVSLHSSAYPSHDVDPYDSVQDEEEEDLNKLIQEANSLDIRHQPNQNKSPVDVMFPSFQRSDPLPQKVSLTSSYPDAFAKIAPPIEPVIAARVTEEKQRAAPKTVYDELPTRKRKSAKESDLHTSLDPLDGDDEISLAESDFPYAVPPIRSTKSTDAQPSYLCEVFPSDYTDFETESELDFRPKGRSMPPQRNYRDVTPYDTVLETDGELPDKENRLNPIVSEDYQICSPMKKTHNTFPKRIKAEKPKAKERTDLDVLAIALTDPSTNAVQPMSLPYPGPQPLRRNKSIPARKSDSGPVSLFGEVPHLVVARDGHHGPKRDPLSPYNGPKSLPVRKKSKVKKETAAPKIHLSLSPSNKTGSEPNSTNPNNLQINLLPSDDPNVINLNISTAPPKQEEVLVKRSSSQPPSEPITLTSLLEPQPIVPITAISHKHETSAKEPEPTDSEAQHRVVEIDPVNIETTPVNPEPLPVTFSEPQVPSVPVVTELPVVPQVVESVQAAPQLVTPLVPVVVQPQTVVPVSLPPQQVQSPQPISTQDTRVFDNSNTIRSQPASVVVEIPQPTWEDRSRTLPSDRRGRDSGMRHGGDSGIDLTNYEKKSRRKRRSSSSTDESEYKRKKRSSSKKKLKNNMNESSVPDLSDQYIEWYKRKYLKPSCCYMFLKHFIFALNLLFGIVGLGLIGLGIWGFADLNSYGLSDPTMVLRDPVFPIFIVGIVITLTCLEGAIGFFRDNICMIKFFGWCLVLLCLIFISGTVAFWILKDNTITPFVMRNFLDMIEHYNTTSKKVASFTIDQMQINFECCGITGYTDWNRLTQFPCREGQCAVPQSCCRPTEITCSRIEAEGPRNDEACKDAMPLWIKNNTAILVGAWLVIICLFIINFVSIHYMIREILYLHQINAKIHSIHDPPEPLDSTTSSSSDDDTSDSEYEERRRRRRRRRKRREKRNRSHYRNKAYR